VPLIYFAEAMLRHPIVLVPPALVLAILYGAGKPFGLPRLFWNERRLYRFYAGVAMTLLAADALLVAYLLDGLDAPARRSSFLDFILVGALLWLLLVGPVALLQHARYRRSKRQDGGIRENQDVAPAIRKVESRGIAPAIRKVDEGGLSSRAALQAPAGALTAGIAVGAVFAFSLALVTRSDFMVPLTNLLSSIASGFGHPVSEPWLHSLALISIALLLVVFVFLRKRASPGVGLCFVLALGLAFYTAIEFWARNAGFGLLLLLLLLWWAGGLRYKLRIPSLMSLYRQPVEYPPPMHSDEPPTPAPLRFDVAVTPALRQLGTRRLILVCASGGGIRAATWTAAILGQLDEIEGFRAATRLLTGASGGMMGAATWLALTATRNSVPGSPASPGTWQSLMSAVAMDSLTPVARQLVFNDIPLAFIGRDNLRDRGLALEAAWCENLKSKLGINLDMPLEKLRDGEESGRWPSLVMSPMMIEDGRRLIISNLDLTEMTDHYVRWLSSKKTGAEPTTSLASRTAYQLWQLCPQAWAKFPLSTAARLSAAFPYVSGAVLLPTKPRLHVVDAGYYDNYGLELASNWLRKLFEQRQDFLKKNISGILVIQIRDNVSELSVNPQSDAWREKRRESEAASGSRLLRALEGISSPPSGLLAARESVMLFRNDSLLESLSHLYSSAFGEDFLTTTVFEFGGEASLSWHLAPEEVRMLEAQARSKGIQLKLKAIDSWLKERDYWNRARRPSIDGRLI